LTDVFATASSDAMNLAVHIAVALSSTAAPNPHPTNAAAAGSAGGQAAESNASGTSAEIASTLGPTGMLLLLAVGVFAVYVVSLSLHPNRKCNRCKGAGRHTGAVFSYAQRPCNSCKGRGVHPRLGRKVLFKT
jgi:DnaJ-class molecular chaperone